MKLHLKIVFGVLVGLAALSATAIVTPQSAHAEAGGGANGGNSGCSASSYSTCFGATWRYYKTNSNAVQIRNVSKAPAYRVTYTTVTNCASTGGFFAYVLVSKTDPTNPNAVRAWEIGPVDGNPGNASQFFGGWTNYYGSKGSPSDPAPVNPAEGDYSWYQARAAFAVTTSLGQSNGYTWDAGSHLGWFCYRGIAFNLRPSVSTNPSAAVAAGSTVNVNGTMVNAGPTTSSSQHWEISQIIVPKGQAAPSSGGDSNRDPRSFFGSSGFSTVDSGSNSFPVGTYSYSPRTVTVNSNLAVGTKLCFVLSVQGYSESTSDWRHSTPSCVVVGKRPTAQILGGDLRVGAAFVGSTAPSGGSNIQTSVTIKSGKSYGTWDEYGLIASGTIKGAGSGSVYSGGLLCTSGCSVNTISFTNSSATIGKYVTSTSIPDVAASFAISGTTPQFSSLADAQYNRVETSNSNITLTGGTIQKGHWLVINAPTKTVTIKGDIKYDTAPLQSLTDIPQLVIIANQINIEGNVSQVDAWLVASGANGTVNTCSAWNGSAVATNAKLTSGICSTPLVINGPVMAKTLYLQRTAGNDTQAQSADPAEVINLRPDAYLWGIGQASNSARLETMYTQDLPPRF